MQSLYTFILFPVMFWVFWALSFKNPKIREGFKLRKNKSWLVPYEPGVRWLWFHVASGELEYAKPVMAQIKKTLQAEVMRRDGGVDDARAKPNPEVAKTKCASPVSENGVSDILIDRSKIKILVTYFSPSVLSSLQKTKDVDLFVPMPWDTPWHWREFIKHFRPLCVAIARTDTWPNMIWTARALNVPSLLFSATLPRTSARAASFITRLFYATVIDKLSHVSCVSEEDAHQFRRLDEELSISSDGDTRFDQVIARVAENRPVREAAQNLKTTFVIGSSWPEDERILIPALVKPVTSGLNVIFAPHEPTPEHLESLERQFAALKLKTIRYSQLAAAPAPITSAKNDRATEIGVKTSGTGRVIIVDIVGVLADLYRVGTIAFVGGSFKKTVHSVMEPAAAGCLTLFGPYHYNNREALSMRAKKLALELQTSEELESLLLNELKIDSAALAERTEKILAFVNAHKGVSAKVAGWILNQVDVHASL